MNEISLFTSDMIESAIFKEFSIEKSRRRRASAKERTKGTSQLEGR